MIEQINDTGVAEAEQFAAFVNAQDDDLSDQNQQTIVNEFDEAFGNSTVNVSQVTLTQDAVAEDGSVSITGTTDGSEALVIDVSGLPSGTVLHLDNVEFAVIIGSATLDGGAGDNIVYGDGSAQYIVLGEGDDKLCGGSGNDTVGSEGGNDFICGEDGNDSLFGGEGDDTLVGAGGNDTIDGGAGDDTVRFSGNYDDYTISYDPETDTYTIEEKQPVTPAALTMSTDNGSDGTDYVTGVEHFMFNETKISVPTVTDFNPDDGADDVPVGSDIVVTFSEKITFGDSGTIAIHEDSATGTIFEEYDVNSQGTNLVIVDDTLTIDPAMDLEPGQQYFITFADGSVLDLNGFAYDGNSDEYDFTTASVETAYAATADDSGFNAGVVVAGIGAVAIIALIL